MQSFFILIVILGMLYFLFKKRTFDFFSLAFISACIYFLPGFFGYSLSPYNQSEIPLINNAYLVMILVLLSILIGGLINDTFHQQKNKIKINLKDYGLYFKLLIIVSIFSFILMVFTSGDMLFNTQKGLMMESLNRFHILWVLSTSLWVILSFLEKRKLLFIFGFIFLLFDVFLGFRSTVAITLMAIITINLNKKGDQVLASKWKMIISGTIFAMFFFVYKKIHAVVKLGRWDLVEERLKDYSFYIESITSSEPFVTQTILNTIMINDFHVGLQHLSSVIYQFIPVNIFIPTNIVSFNSMFQSTLFPGLNFGLANNIWAEMYSSGGWLLLILFLIIFNLVIFVGNYLLKMKDNKLIATISMVMVYWAFYIHRNSLGYEINLMKRVFLVSIIIFMISLLIASGIKKNKKIINRQKYNSCESGNLNAK